MSLKSNISSSPFQTQLHINSTHRLQRWRKIFPILAGIVLCTILFWTKLENFFNPSTKIDLKADSSVLIRNRLMAPKLLSVDQKGKAYSISAESVQQQGEHQAEFEKPYLKMEISKGIFVEITSQAAQYNDLTKNIIYQQNVILLTNTGYKLETSKALVDLNKKEAFGDNEIKGQGPMGYIHAHGFSATESGKISFKGKTKLIIHQNSKTLKLTSDLKIFKTGASS